MCLSSFSFLPKGPRVVPVWIRGTEYTVYTLYTNKQQHSFPLLSRRHKPTTFFPPTSLRRMLSHIPLGTPRNQMLAFSEDDRRGGGPFFHSHNNTLPPPAKPLSLPSFAAHTTCWVGKRKKGHSWVYFCREGEQTQIQ